MSLPVVQHRTNDGAYLLASIAIVTVKCHPGISTNLLLTLLRCLLFLPYATTPDGCVKLANGHNWRGIQPVNGRIIKLAT